MTSPAPSVLAGLRQALMAHAPFSGMRKRDLDGLVRSIVVGYHPAGETILSPTGTRPEHCHFIRQGAVHGEPMHEPGARPSVYAWDGGVGDMFPLGPLLARRGVTRVYRAVQDTFLLVFPAAVFDDLIERSPVFADFCARRLAHLVDLARAELQAEYAAQTTEERSSSTPLAELKRHAPVTVEGSLPLRDALRLMEARRIGSLPIIDATGRPTGIFTRQDVIGRVVLAERSLTTPIRDLASAPVVTLPETATAGDAALEMTSRGIRHVVVVDGSGRVSGVVSERDLFGLQRLSVRELASDIRRAADRKALARIAEEVRALSYALVAQGVASGPLTRMIASLNDQIVQRVLDLAAPGHALAGLSVCWIGMGSEGRSEQTIATDQDNGLIFVPDTSISPDAVRERLLPLAREVNHALDALGFPLCKGGVMAMNPRWCASLDEWRAAFGGWIERGDPESLLAASIFFDFRGLWGDLALVRTLREEVAKRAEANPRFLKQLSDNALRNPPALNWFGELSPVEDAAGVKGFDLKLNGASLFVDGARILALATGVTATSTVERLARAGAALDAPATEIGSWCDAFEYLQLLRLRTQHRRASGALKPSQSPNFVPLADLSELDRRILRHALRQARALQQRLELDYPG